MEKKVSHILIGITSGIAAYKMVPVVQQLVDDGHRVTVIRTDHAKHMVSEKDLVSAGAEMSPEMYPIDLDIGDILHTRHVPHIDLADSADLFVVAPATANSIAKLSYGIADDLLGTVALAVQCPMLIFPSMNVHMWQHSIVQQNIKTLQERGVYVILPEDGNLACGYTGPGRLPSQEHMVSEIYQLLSSASSMKGRRVVITSGGTIEPIDEVRQIATRASGKMGYACARVCKERGASVVYVRSETAIPCQGVEEKVFSTEKELYAYMREEVPRSDMVIHTAAVGDFDATYTEGKLDSARLHTIRLTPREKIISQIKVWNPKVYLLGFKAVVGLPDEEMISVAKEKLLSSHADAIFVNDVGKKDRGFGADTNEGFLLKKNTPEPIHIPFSSKRQIAQHIISLLD